MRRMPKSENGEAVGERVVEAGVPQRDRERAGEASTGSRESAGDVEREEAVLLEAAVDGAARLPVVEEDAEEEERREATSVVAPSTRRGSGSRERRKKSSGASRPIIVKTTSFGDDVRLVSGSTRRLDPTTSSERDRTSRACDPRLHEPPCGRDALGVGSRSRRRRGFRSSAEASRRSRASARANSFRRYESVDVRAGAPRARSRSRAPSRRRRRRATFRPAKSFGSCSRL